MDIQNTTNISQCQVECVLKSKSPHLDSRLLFTLINGRPGPVNPQFEKQVQHRYNNVTHQLEIEVLGIRSEDVEDVSCKYIDTPGGTRVISKFTLLNFAD